MTWATSSNLQTITPTDYSIDVKSINTNTGYAWIKATFDDGSSITKNIVGKPDYNLNISYDFFVELDIESLNVPLSNQEITSIEWVKTSGSGTLISDPNTYPALVANGQVEGYVDVYNSCGYTRSFFNVSTNGYNCENPYYIIESLGQDKYKLVDACDPDNIQYVVSSELYDSYGVKIQDLIPQQDEVDMSNTSNSGEIRIIIFIKDGQVFTKMVIAD